MWCRCWYRYCSAFLSQELKRLKSSVGPGTATRSFSWVIHTIRGDATNSAVGSHHCKAHCCEISSLYKFPCTSDLQAPDVRPHLVTKTEPVLKVEPCVHSSDELLPLLDPPHACHNSVYADLQKVPSSCTGPVQRNMFIKQICSVGCRPWTESADELYETQSEGPEGHQHFECWVFTTDAGPDQTAEE